MSQKERFAVLASLAVLQSLNEGEPTEHNHQSTPILPLKGFVYLWTFTFPDLTTLEQASRKWTLFANYLRRARQDVKWMRFLEPHQTHGWHVHTVAAQRYDVTMMRKHAERFGFGRIHVLRIPASQAGYITKYVTKFKRRSSDGRYRLWACNGFKGCTVASVRTTDTWNTQCFGNIGFKDLTSYSLATVYRLGLENEIARSHTGDGLPKPKTKIIMNATQEKSALALLNTGAKVAFIEYRNTKVREARKYIDGRASLSEKSYYLQHFLETNGAPMLVEEVLTDSFKPTDSIAPPMKKGQTAIAEITKISVFNGKETFQARFHAVS